MFAKTEVNQFFPSCVWAHELSGAAALNRALLAELERLRAVEPSAASTPGTWQSRGDLHRRPAVAPLAEAIRAAVGGVLEFLRCRHQGFEITDCWANVNFRDYAHREHTHPNNFLSGVYYVKVPPGSGRIVFLDPRPQAGVLVPAVTAYTPHNSYKHPIEPAEGLLLVFHSWLAHMVEPNRSDDDRVSVSFNAMLRGEVGYESGRARL